MEQSNSKEEVLDDLRQTGLLKNESRMGFRYLQSSAQCKLILSYLFKYCAKMQFQTYSFNFDDLAELYIPPATLYLVTKRMMVFGFISKMDIKDNKKIKFIFDSESGVNKQAKEMLSL